MAKTTSQIVKENQERQKKINEAVAYSKKVDKQYADTYARAAAKTAAVLGKAAGSTSDSSKKKDLYSAIKVVSDTKKSEPKTQSTATSMQKKKEDRMEAKNPVDSLYLRKTFAEKQLKEFDEKNENPEYWQDVKEKRAYDVKRRELQEAVDRAGVELQARDDARTHATNMQDIANMAPEEQQLLQDAVKSRQNKSIADNGTTIGGLKKIYELKQMYDLLPLVRKYGDARTLELLEALEREENQKKAMDYQAKGQEAAASGPVASVAANIASIPINAVAGIESAYSRAKEMLFRTGQYSTLSPYASGDQYAALAGGVRQQTMQNIEGEDPNLLQKGVSIGYQGVMAAADSIARAFLGGGAIGGSMLAATNSFAQTMSEASQQGATPAQAAIMATTTAGIEYLSEKIPLDNLIKTAKGTGAKSVILNALRQAGIEATTEEISLMATVLAEAAILQEKSAYQQRITGLILQGVAPEEARRQANMDIVNEAINTLLVSAVSGSVSSAAGSYADAKGMFAAEQERSNPELAKPKAKNAEQARAELLQKYPELAQQQVQQPQGQDMAADAAQAPAAVLKAIKNQEADDQWSDRVAPYRSDDLAAIEADPQAMQWLAERGLSGDLQQALDAVQKGNYSLNAQNSQTQQTQRQSVEAAPVQQTQQETTAQQESAPQVDTQKESSQGGQPETTWRELANRLDNKKESNPSRIIDDIGIAVAKEVVNTAEKGTTASELKKLSDDAMAEYEALQASVPYGKSYTESQKATLTALYNMYSYYDTLSKNPNFLPMLKQGIADGEAELAGITTEQTQQPQNQQTVPNTEQVQQNQSTNADGQTQEGAELQRERVNAVRPQEITVEDSQGRKISEAAGNIYTSARTPDSFTENIKRLVSEGRVSHDVQTNEQSLQMAAESIAKDGSIQNALNSIKEVADSGRTGALDVAKGVLIYDELVNSNNPTDQALAEDCFTTLCQLATNTGRPMQLYSLFRKMSPESQVNVIRNEINRNIARMQKAGTVKKDYQAEVDPELLQMYQDAAAEHQKAKGDKAKRAAEEKMQDIQNVIYMTEAAKVPTTFKAKWDAWRYMAMLGNVKTQVRNVVGNAAMVPYTAAKRKIGALLEMATIRDKNERTKAFSQDKELLNWAKNDRTEPEVLRALKQSAKLGDQQDNTVFQENVKTFGDSWVGERANELQGIITKAVQGGDLWFKNREYARSLAGFIKARGYTAADIQNNNVPVEVLNEGRNYAVNEALRATFNDSNQLSDWFSSIGRSKDSNVFAKATNLMLEGVIPFRKTPANVLARGWEYSPMGIITTVLNTGKDIHNGNYSAATAIDRLSANLTGSAMLVLGYALADGLGNIRLRGGDVDEDETRQGMQKNSVEIKIGGETHSYTIDWLAPSNLPLLMGVNLYESMQDPDTSSFITACMNVGLNTLEPMLELSCLSGLNDFLESARYAEEGETLYTLISKAATSYFTQGVPSLARQTTQAANEYKKTTFVTSDDKVISSTQKTIAGLGVGNPYKTDKVTAWGEKESTGTTGERIFNAFFNPGTRKKIDNSPLEQEINRINSTPGNNVTPPYMPKTITYTDSDGNTHENYRLSEQEYQAVAQTQGQTAKRILDTMISSDNYKAMSDAEKAKAINQVYSYARVKAQVDNIDNHTGYDESWMMELKEGREAEEILRRTTNNVINSAMTSLQSAWDNGYKADSRSNDLEAAYDSYKAMTPAQKRQAREFATGNSARYLEARDKGIPHQTAVTVFKKVADLKPEKDYTNIRDIQIREAIAQMPGLTDKSKDTLLRAYMPDYDPKAKSPQTTELKYNEIRDLGISPEGYTDAYRDYLDASGTGKRRRTIKHYQDEYGWDRKTATSVYDLLAGYSKPWKE